MNMSRRQIVGLSVLIVLALGACLARWMIDRDLTPGVVGLRWPDANVASFRFTAIVVGASVGVSLAISGLLLQVLLRNPLASPFILGISSGAGLGVMAATYAAWVTAGAAVGIGGFVGEQIAALLGGGAALLIVFLLGQRRGVLDPISLILIGVVVSTICAAGIMFFQHLVPTGLRGDFTRWLMGTIPEAMTSTALWTASVMAVGGVIVAWWIGRAMDAAMLGDDEARSVGLALGRLRVVLFCLAGVLTAMTVGMAGIIGFVGLICPHLARLILGPQHRPLVLGSALLGIILVVGADAGRQAVDFGAGRMPIGILTAVIGGPMFLWLLLRDRGKWA